MLRRASDWLKSHAAILTLLACTLVPGLGWTVNMIWPAEVYGYLHEQALLALFGVAALILARDSIKAAVTLYFIGALLPVGAMVEHHASGFTPLIAIPLAGVFVVSSLVHCPWATGVYTVAASLAGAIFGLLYADVGGAVAGAFVTLVIGASKTQGCANYITREQADAVHKAKADIEQAALDVSLALGKTGQLERGLDNLLEEFANGHTTAGPPAS